MAKTSKPAGKHRRSGSPVLARSVVYGWHSGLAALQNPERVIHGIYATANAAKRLAETSLALSGPEICDSRAIDRIAGHGV